MQRASNDPHHTMMGLKGLPIRSIFDVGANEGQFARSIVKHFPAAKLYCFEPLPQPFAILQKWAAGRPDTHVFNIALGDVPGSVPMYIHTDHTPSSSILRTTSLSTALYPVTARQEETMVAVRRLDDVVAELPRPPEGDILVKMDVQGFEANVIRGARQFLAGAVRACIVEVSLDELYEGQGAFRDVFNELDPLGYRYAGNLSQVYGSDGHVIYIDAVFIR